MSNTGIGCGAGRRRLPSEIARTGTRLGRAGTAAGGWAAGGDMPLLPTFVACDIGLVLGTMS
jgi:hypothetical protein